MDCRKVARLTSDIALCFSLQKTLSLKKLNTDKTPAFISAHNPVIVMDAGIATDDNMLMLKSKGYDYLCVSRCMRDRVP